MLGINHTHFFSNTTRLKTSLALTSTIPYGGVDSLSGEDGQVLKNLGKYEEKQNDIVFQSVLTHKFNTKNKLKTGFSLHNYSVDFYEKDYEYDHDNDSSTYYDPFTIKKNNLYLLISSSGWHPASRDGILDCGMASLIEGWHPFSDNNPEGKKCIPSSCLSR